MQGGCKTFKGTLACNSLKMGNHWRVKLWNVCLGLEAINDVLQSYTCSPLQLVLARNKFMFSAKSTAGM